MNIRSLCFSIFAIACSGGVTLEEEIGQNEQEISSADWYGWDGNAGSDDWQRWSCNVNDPATRCILPKNRPLFSGANEYVRTVDSASKTNILAGFPSTFSAASQMSLAQDFWRNSGPFDFSTGSCSALCGGTDLSFSVNNNISGNLPNTNIFVSDVVHLVCTSVSPVLTETPVFAASFEKCNSHVAQIDVQSFTNWVNLWATNNTQRQTMTRILFKNILGAIQGMGQVTNLGNATVMASSLYRFSGDNNITPFEVCQLNSFGFGVNDQITINEHICDSYHQ